DAEQQKTQVQELIDAKVSAILINPVDSDAIVPAVEAANAANIPVLTIDRSANGGTIVSHVASDNLAGGRMAAGYLLENLGGTGKVVELEGIAGTSAAEARGAGFNEAIAKAEGIEIIARETANFNREEGKTVFAQILEQHEQIDGVFAHNDEMILGALEAAKEADRAGAIRFVGFDAVEDAVAAVESGDLLATVAQQPAEMGRLGVEAAVDHLNGKTIPASIPVDLALITK
ncbi:MAG: substrate-binding domain-containing protein, partial [Anaerolineae bacterium]|nr:substrate-binding domain-containing protein [Anaerolineae bacterium]